MLCQKATVDISTRASYEASTVCDLELLREQERVQCRRMAQVEEAKALLAAVLNFNITLCSRK